MIMANSNFTEVLLYSTDCLLQRKLSQIGFTFPEVYIALNFSSRCPIECISFLFFFFRIKPKCTSWYTWKDNRCTGMYFGLPNCLLNNASHHSVGKRCFNSYGCKINSIGENPDHF